MLQHDLMPVQAAGCLTSDLHACRSPAWQAGAPACQLKAAQLATSLHFPPSTLIPPSRAPQAAKGCPSGSRSSSSSMSSSRRHQPSPSLPQRLRPSLQTSMPGPQPSLRPANPQLPRSPLQPGGHPPRPSQHPTKRPPRRQPPPSPTSPPTSLLTSPQLPSQARCLQSSLPGPQLPPRSLRTLPSLLQHQQLHQAIPAPRRTC